MTLHTAFFGAGCFWCTEAAFQMIKGVISVTSGYAGGETQKPSYEAVSSGTTGHAEVAKIEYDPSLISYSDLLSVFFTIHNPTTLNRQGADVGTQYRSLILHTTKEQKETAAKFIQNLRADHVFDQPIVTEIKPFEVFYPAEAYHQNYFQANPDKPYCSVVISPKLSKLRAHHQSLLK